MTVSNHKKAPCKNLAGGFQHPAEIRHFPTRFDFFPTRRRKYIDEDKLSLWCQIQALKADCPEMTYGEAAERLGLSRWTVYRALQTLHRHIRRETYRIAASLDYL